MDSNFGKGFRDQLHDLNRTVLEHDLLSVDSCQNKENVETLSEVKYVPDVLTSSDSSAMENARENEIIPLDVREFKLHKIPQLPDQEVRKAISEVFADNFLENESSSGGAVKLYDGPLTSSCSVGHINHAHDNNNSSTANCFLEACYGNDINFREEMKFISSLSSFGRTEKRTDITFQPRLRENLSTHFRGRQSKDEIALVTPLTFLNTNECNKYGRDSNTDRNTKQILDLGKQENHEDAVSHRQQVCYVK